MRININGKRFELTGDGNSYTLIAEDSFPQKWFFFIIGVHEYDVDDFIELVKYTKLENLENVYRDMLSSLRWGNYKKSSEALDKLIAATGRLMEDLRVKLEEHQAAEKEKPIDAPKPKDEEEPDDFIGIDDEESMVDVVVREVGEVKPPLWRQIKLTAIEYGWPTIQFLAVVAAVVAMMTLHGWITAKFVAKRLQAETHVEAVGHQEGAGQTAPAPRP